ncbi:hypothetical protein [Microbacterium pumilum]
MVDGNAAAQSLLALPRCDIGKCLQHVWRAYADHGASVSGLWPTAFAAWTDSPGKHEGDRNPPAGVPVWWGERINPSPGDRNAHAGDVVISLGGGRVAATDFPGNTQVGTTTLDARQNQIRRIYLGWTETILGVPIDGIAQGVLAEVPQRPKEKNMSYSLVPLSNSDEIHVVSLITGIQAHIKNPVHLNLLNRVKKNEFNDEMRQRELDIVRGYLTAINPPPHVEIDAQALADALSDISEDVDPATVSDRVNDAITTNSRIADAVGDGALNNRL